jgi:hypothetical protein
MRLTPADVTALARVAGLMLDENRALALVREAAFLLQEAEKLEQAGEQEEGPWRSTASPQA